MIIDDKKTIYFAQINVSHTQPLKKQKIECILNNLFLPVIFNYHAHLLHQLEHQTFTLSCLTLFLYSF